MNELWPFWSHVSPSHFLSFSISNKTVQVLLGEKWHLWLSFRNHMSKQIKHWSPKRKLFLNSSPFFSCSSLLTWQHEMQPRSVFWPAEINCSWNLPFHLLPQVNITLLLNWLKSPCPGLCKVCLVSPHLVFLWLFSTLSPFQGVYESSPCGKKALVVFALRIVFWQGAKGACQSTGPKVSEQREPLPLATEESVLLQ